MSKELLNAVDKALKERGIYTNPLISPSMFKKVADEIKKKYDNVEIEYETQTIKLTQNKDEVKRYEIKLNKSVVDKLKEIYNADSISIAVQMAIREALSSHGVNININVKQKEKKLEEILT